MQKNQILSNQKRIFYLSNQRQYLYNILIGKCPLFCLLSYKIYRHKKEFFYQYFQWLFLICLTLLWWSGSHLKLHTPNIMGFKVITLILRLIWNFQRSVLNKVNLSICKKVSEINFSSCVSKKYLISKLNNV